jgi:4-amino-4-deoxy-L-arabinose transferase-like glycosyltransferase
LNNVVLAPVRRGDLIGAMVFFAVVNAGLVAINGIRHGGDTPLYLDGATRMLDGRPLIDRESSYAGYVLMVAAAQAIGVGTTGVVVVQVVLGAAAAAAVFLLGAGLAGRAAGAIAVTLYTLDVDTNRWHQFILADSLYVSLMTLGVLLTYRAASRRDVVPAIGALAVVVCAALVRPEGWFLLPAAGCFLVWVRARSGAQRLAGAGVVAAGAVVLMVVMAPVLRGNLQAVGPARMLERGQTIWEFNGWRVPMPPATNVEPGESPGAVAYAVQHPVKTLTLMLARVGVHFAHVRPFYSTAHNMVIVVWLVPVYVAAGYAIRRLGGQRLPSWILAAIATQTLVVALTHAEWDGRYLAHVLPLIDTLAGAGVAMAIGHQPPGPTAHA